MRESCRARSSLLCTVVAYKWLTKKEQVASKLDTDCQNAGVTRVGDIITAISPRFALHVARIEVKILSKSLHNSLITMATAMSAKPQVFQGMRASTSLKSAQAKVAYSFHCSSLAVEREVAIRL